jgi:hypothetical protein
MPLAAVRSQGTEGTSGTEEDAARTETATFCQQCGGDASGKPHDDGSGFVALR